jgi:hypothetical protein
MGGGAGAQAPTPNGERSDASGLLDHNVEPWAGHTDTGDDMATQLGTAEGGEGLTLPAEGGAALETTAAETTAPGAGMPYLPGMGGGAGAQAPTPNGERSDASGLLEQNVEPWTGEADGETAEPGTAAGGEGLALPFFPGQAVPEQAHAEVQEPATAALLAEEAAVVWAERTAKNEHETEREIEAEEPTEKQSVSEHAAVATALPITLGDDDSSLAWDVAGAAFAPLLWAASTEDEADITVDGPATADEGTWGPAAEPSFTTWQPSRTGEAAATPASAALASATLACSTEDVPPDPEEEPPAEAPDEEAPARGAADLLVQERDLWGASDAEGLGAII